MKLNGEVIEIKNEDFPLLVSAKEGSGASPFTIQLAIDQFRLGRNVLFFSAFPAAKEDLKTLLTEAELSEVESVEQVVDIYGKRLILINSGDALVLIEAIQTLADRVDRLIVIKNIEEYDLPVFDTVKDLNYVILSGDTDACAFTNDLKQKTFSTKIFFSKPKKLAIENFPELKTYQGVAFGKRINGFVTLE